MPDPQDARSLLFYSDWPLGYHNQEAERKARHFARAGYDVVYVAGIGTRNPRLTSARKLADRAMRKVRPEPASPARPGEADDVTLRTAALAVTPPRQAPAVRRLNEAWVERQLRAAIAEWPRSVAWIRSATPELVGALERLRPAATIYEVVDAHHLGPGMTGVWSRLFEEAERRLVSLADAVVVTSRSLAPRFEAWGAPVDFIGHGVDLFPLPDVLATGSTDAPVLGFVGVLDARLDPTVIRHVATMRPQWRIRLVGPVENGFDPAALADLPNVTVEPPIPHAEVGARLAQFDLGFLAYGDFPQYEHMSPLKNLELLAAGKPVVARPNPALREFAEFVEFASSPAEFLTAAERALASDDPGRRQARRAVAEANTWDARLRQLDDVLARALDA